MSLTKIIDVTLDNVIEETLFCVKNVNSAAFQSKRKWFENRAAEGLRMKILKDGTNKMIGFIEYVPAAKAWRPVNAPNFMFVHCMYVYSKKDRNQGYGSALLKEAEKEAIAKAMDGLCVITSKGAWLADKTLFEKNGFTIVDKRDRFELLSKKWNSNANDPKLRDWTQQQKKYQGWHLRYANQCPWHEKSVEAMLNVAYEYGIDLKVTQITSSEEAKNAPSGFAVFNLLHNGKLLEDHYLSAGRFRNILKKELQN